MGWMDGVDAVAHLAASISVTRFCDGHRLDLRARLRLFAQVCAGVQHAQPGGETTTGARLRYG